MSLPFLILKGFIIAQNNSCIITVPALWPLAAEMLPSSQTALLLLRGRLFIVQIGPTF